MSIAAIAAGVLLAAAPTFAQVSSSWSGEEGQPGSMQSVNPSVDSEVQVIQCYKVGLLKRAKGLVSVDVKAENPNGDWNVGLDFSIVDSPEKVIQWIAGKVLKGPPFPIMPCPPTGIEDYGTLSGNASLYSFAIGGGMHGGLTYIRRARSTISMDMPFKVTSETHQEVELPVSISGSVVVAESFGDPEQTRGYASLTLSGTIAGVAVDETVEVESVSAIPIQDSISFHRAVRVSLQPGVNVFHVSIEGEAELEAMATSAGLFGTLSGSATAGVNMPNSIRIGRLTGVDGAPLPPGIVVRNADTGFVYENTTDPCIADWNLDGEVDVNDFFAYLGDFADGDPLADLNNDGEIDINDFFIFLQEFEAGC